MFKLTAVILLSSLVVFPSMALAQANQASGGQAVRTSVQNPLVPAGRVRGDIISENAQGGELDDWAGCAPPARIDPVTQDCVVGAGVVVDIIE